MAILQVQESIRDRTLESTVESGALIRTYNKLFHAITDSASHTPLEIVAALQSSQLITYGAAHPEDGFARVVAINPEITESPYVWGVSVTYTNRAASAEADLLPADPLQHPPDVEWFFTTISQVVDRDLFYNLPVANTTDDEFDPPLEEDEYILSLRYTRNEAFYDQVLASDYQNSVNSDIFLGYAPGEARIVNIGARRVRDSGFFYYEVIYEFQFRSNYTVGEDEPVRYFDLSLAEAEPGQTVEGWDRKILNAGFYYFNGGTDRIKIKDSEGQDVTVPVKLNELGEVLADGEKPIYLVTRSKKRRSFAVLNIT